MEELHQAQPCLDPVEVHQRRGQILPQQPCTRPRHRAIDRAQQAARARAASRRNDLQTLARRRVDRDMAAARLAQRWSQEGQGALARMVEISDQPTHRR